MERIDVRYQKHLKNLGLYTGNIDGLYGPQTRMAVIKFQTMNGLSADGIIGPRTREEFESELRPIPGRDIAEPRQERPLGNVPYTRWPRETQSELFRFYGDVGEHQTYIDVPYPMVLAWDKSYKVTRIQCHEKVADSLHNILTKVRERYNNQEINKHGFNLFGGSTNVRKIRGGNRWSTHAWGIAIDIDPARNGLKTPWNRAYLSRPECEGFVEAFKSEGWYSLGLEKNYDAMHMQACYR